MMSYDKKTNVMTMDLMDLEHCGFDRDDLDKELFLHGIDDDEARNPFVILVNYDAGHVICPGTSKERLAEIRTQDIKFKRLAELVKTELRRSQS
jgi:hypothetical protein